MSGFKPGVMLSQPLIIDVSKRALGEVIQTIEGELRILDELGFTPEHEVCRRLDGIRRQLANADRVLNIQSEYWQRTDEGESDERRTTPQ